MNATIIPAALITGFILSCENPADSTADATTTESIPAAQAIGTKYVLSDSSMIGFIGSKVTGSHKGGFKDLEGYFTVNDDGVVTGGTIAIDMSSTFTDAEKLTGHLKSADFFHVEEFPHSVFTLTGVEKTNNGYAVAGNLLLRGVEKNITFPARASKEGETIRIEAEFDINRKDWGIVHAGKADDLIRDEVVITFDLSALPEN